MIKKHLLSASILLAISTGIQASNDTAIPKFPAKAIPAGEELDILYNMVNDHQDFVRPLSLLAHFLGFAWLGGNHSKYVGEDMTVQQMGDQWVIQGNNDGHCDGYRCGEKTKITVDNFKYTLMPGEFWHGDVLKSEKQLVRTVSTTVRNLTDEDQVVQLDMVVDEVTTWSKEGKFGFEEMVMSEGTLTFPFVGETNLAVSFEGKQNFSDTNGGKTEETSKFQAEATVPANSEIPVSINLYRSSISYPYRIGARISYDVTFEGFLRWSGNAWHTHPDNRPNKKHTFTVGRQSLEPKEHEYLGRNWGHSADIAFQWDHRDSPVQEKFWDWNWAIHKFGMNTMQAVTGGVLRPFHSYVEGDFRAEAIFAGEIEVGEAVEIATTTKPSSHSAGQINAAMYSPPDGVVVVTDFDADELGALGFSNAQFTVRTLEE